MKLPVTIGLLNLEPYLYVNEDNTIGGSFAPFVNARYYFFFQKFNVNLVDLGPRVADVCNDHGICSGSLSFLQTGTIDFAETFTQSQFPTLPINLTIGTIMKEEECHLINRPTKRIDFRSDDFIAINQRLDSRVILLTVFYCFGFMFLLMLTNRLLHSLSHKVTLTFWSLYEIALGRSHLPLVNNFSLFGLNFSWFAFFSIMMITTTFQTGLIQSTYYLQIDTLQDILTHSCIPTALGILYCRRPIQGSKIPLYQKVASRMDIITPEATSPVKMIEIVNNSSRVLIANKAFTYRLKGMTCMLDGPEEEGLSTLYVSKRPVAQLLYLMVLSSATKPVIKRNALRAAYSAFETSNFDNPVLRRIDLGSVGVRNLYGQCIQAETNDNSIILTPLSLKYFTRTIIFFMIGLAIAFAIFLVELIISTLDVGN